MKDKDELAERREATGEQEVPRDGENPEADAEEDLTQLSIEGDADIKLGSIGGRKPDQSTLIIRGGEIHVGGRLKKGQRVRIVLEGPVTGEHYDDLKDPKTGGIRSTKVKHIMKPDYIQRQEIALDDADKKAA